MGVHQGIATKECLVFRSVRGKDEGMSNRGVLRERTRSDKGGTEEQGARKKENITPSFSKGGSSFFAPLVKEDHHHVFLVQVDLFIHNEVGLHDHQPTCGVLILPREVFWEPSHYLSRFVMASHCYICHRLFRGGFKRSFFFAGDFDVKIGRAHV